MKTLLSLVEYKISVMISKVICYCLKVNKIKQLLVGHLFMESLGTLQVKLYALTGKESVLLNILHVRFNLSVAILVMNGYGFGSGRTCKNNFSFSRSFFGVSPKNKNIIENCS